MDWLDIAKAVAGGVALLGGGVVIGRYFPRAPGGAAAFAKRREEALKKPMPGPAPLTTRIHRFTDDEQ